MPLAGTRLADMLLETENNKQLQTECYTQSDCFWRQESVAMAKGHVI